MSAGQCALFATGLLAAAMSCVAAEPVTLDDFDSLAGWSIEATEGVKARLRAAPGAAGGALCLAYDFGRVSGYALARRRIPIDFPANFELGFDVRGSGPPNALHVRFADDSGDNVWWHPIAGFHPPRVWQRLRIRKRHVAFAWGRSADHALRHTATVEFAIAREQGGRGELCFDRLTLRERPALAPPAPRPIAWATSNAAGSEASFAVDGASATAWRSAAAGEQALTIDLGIEREFGGLVLRWLPGSHATRYDVELSDDGDHWQLAREMTAGGGGPDALRMPESQARYVRVRMHAGAAASYGLAEFEIRGVEFGATPNAFFEALAREAPRGRYPRGLSGEQLYWTVVGVDGGSAQALLSEDGALEPRAGEAAIEPLLLTDDGLVTWADVEIDHALAEEYLPMPSVTWRRRDLALRVEAFGAGDRSRNQVVARYTVGNRASRAQRVTLVLALRPFQVNPPSQFLNTPGGVATMRTLSWDGAALTVDGARRVWPLSPPDEAFALPFDAGNLAERVQGSRRAFARSVQDDTGWPSAAVLYSLDIPAGGARSVSIVVPLAGAPRLPLGDPDSWVDEQARIVAGAWKEKLDRVVLRVPPAGQPLADTVRTALAHILIERNGPAIQPGTRAYARSWIRDGALTSEALLRLGQPSVVRAFADWFALHQFASGKVPCCADRRGADPVPENDSHGEWIRLVGEYFRYTHDIEWLRGKWPSVSRAVAYMEKLRAEGRRIDGAAAMGYAGLMPPSISHEGYSDRPAWSYWDDFWALDGYRSATRIAGSLGRKYQARTLAAARDSFAHDLEASIAASRERHGIDYIPGSADRGDFDATSTTIALAPGGPGDSLPRAWMDATFKRYWREFVARRDGKSAWDAYTPYEIRNIGAFTRLGSRERASELLDFFMADRRPAAWNQWAEVVGREPRKPRFIGDMPHGWVASDFIRAALDLFAYERNTDHAMVLAGGVPDAWLDGQGIAVERLRTPWGLLSYSLHRGPAGLVLEVPAGAAMPPGGLVFATPGREIRITRLPARRVIP